MIMENDMKFYGIDYDEIHINITNVASYWGSAMPMMTMEELAELATEISHVERCKSYNKDKLMKELADVYISLYAIMDHYDIDPLRIESLINKKLTNKTNILAAREGFTNFIFDECGCGVRTLNALMRSNIDTIPVLKSRISQNEKTWWKDVRGLGKEPAEHITETFQRHYGNKED